MKLPNARLLLHPVFLISLFLLLINDLSLKYEFHNWFTGKLSDFAGLYVFSIFFIVVLPFNKIYVLLSSAVLFVWWKSSLSGEFISYWNGVMPFQINRVIDYSDLLALLVLLFAYFNTKYPGALPERPNRYFTAGVGIVCLFSFCFTSAPRYSMYEYPGKDYVHFEERFHSKLNEAGVLQRLTERHISFKTDSVNRFQMSSVTQQYYLRTGTETDSSFGWIPLPVNQDDTLLFSQYTSRPYYLVTSYKVGEHSIRDLRVEIYRRGKNKSTIYIRSFRSAEVKAVWNDKLRKEFRRNFKELLK